MSTATVVECEGDDCPDTTDGATTDTNVTLPVTFCPFRDKLVIDGDGKATITTNDSQYADGNYNQITLISGCVSGLENVAARGYVSNTCCPEETTGDEAETITAAADACNLSSITGTEILTRGYFSDTNGYIVSGCGKANNPWTIEGPSSPELTIDIEQCTANQAVTVSGLGTTASPLRICHKAGTLVAGTYDGITLDSTGHVTGVNISDSDNHNTYISDDFIIAPTDTENEFRITKKPVTTGQTITISGYDVTYDDYGDITNVTGDGVIDDGTANAPVGLNTVVQYKKQDDTIGALTFTDGILTGTT